MIYRRRTYPRHYQILCMVCEAKSAPFPVIVEDYNDYTSFHGWVPEGWAAFNDKPPLEDFIQGHCPKHLTLPWPTITTASP